MKAPVLTAYIFFFCMSLHLNAQDIQTVGDTCAFDYTTYTKLNDSVYSVLFLRGEVKRFEGRFINPRTFVHLGSNMSDEKVNIDYLGLKPDGICIHRNGLGSITEWGKYENGILTELKKFKHDTLYFHIYTKKSVEYRKTYAGGKTISTEKYYPDKHLLISKNGKTVTRFATGKDRYHLLYIYGNKSITEYRFEDRKTITYFYDKTFIVKKNETYKNGRLYYIEEFDIQKRPLVYAYFDSKGNLYEKKTISYSGDSLHSKTISIFVSKINPDKNDDELYTIYKKQSIAEYKSNHHFYRVSFKADTLEVNFEDRSPNNRPHSLDVRIITVENPTAYISYEENSQYANAYSVQKIADFEIRTTAKGYQLNPYLRNILYNHHSQYLMLNLAYDFSYDLHTLNNILQTLLSQAEFRQRTDSIFKSGQLKYINYLSGDTVVLFEIVAGETQLRYHSHLFHIAKDQELCNLGLKTNDGKWLNQNRYEQMDKLDLGFNQQYYVGYSSAYLSIYDWKGKLIFGPLYGVRYGNFDPEYSSVKYYYNPKSDSDTTEVTDILFLVDNTRDSIFGFADINGQLVHRSKYRIQSYYSSNYLGEGWQTEYRDMRGFADMNGIILQPVYQSVYKTKNGDFIVSDSLGYFMLDSTGRTLFKDRYPNIEINSDSNTVVFKDQRVMVYNLEHSRIVFESSELELDYLNSFLYKTKNKSTGKLGLASRGFNFRTKTIYDEILVYTDAIICKNGKTYEFYDNQLKMLNTVTADTIYFNSHDVAGWNRNQIYYHDAGNDFPIRRIRYGSDNKIGLLNMYGEIIIPAKYDRIGLDDQHNCYGIMGEQSDCYGTGNKLHHKNEAFPRETFTPVYEWKSHALLKVLDWKGDEIKISIHEIKYLNPNLYSISAGGNVTGFMNRRGQLMFNIDSIQTIEYDNGFYYYKNKRQQAGVMNCRFVPLLKPAYFYISDMYQNRYVWLSNKGDLYYHYQNYPLASWRLMDVKTGRMLKDTFYNPVPVNATFTIVKNKNGLLGILDSNLNYFRNCIYTSYLNLHIEGLYIFKTTDSSMDIFNSDFGYLQTIRYDMIRQIGDGYLAFKNEFTYHLDKEFKVTDSSKCMFADRESSFYKTDSFVFSDYFWLYLERYSDKKYNESQIERWQKRLPAAAFNFYQVVLSLQGENFTQNLNQGRIHFLPNIEHQYHYPDPYRWDYPGISHSIWVSTHNPRIVNYPEFNINETDYQIEGYKGRLCTFSKGSSAYSNERTYVHYFFGSQGASEINLTDLIDDAKAEAFEKLLLKKVNMLDDPEAPCLKKDDLLNTYSGSFIFGIDGIVVVIDSEFHFTISYEELKEYLNKSYLSGW